MNYEYTVKIERINEDGSRDVICEDSSKIEDSFMNLVGRGLRMVDRDERHQEELQEYIEDNNTHPTEGI
ncbi:MAG: hypothetical protein ABII39_03605 [Candidatus Micrarchaeota archaeon]